MTEKKYIVKVNDSVEHPCENYGGISTHVMSAQELVDFFQEEMAEHSYQKLGRHCKSWSAIWSEGLYTYERTITVKEA